MIDDNNILEFFTSLPLSKIQEVIRLEAENKVKKEKLEKLIGGFNGL